MPWEIHTINHVKLASMSATSRATACRAVKSRPGSTLGVRTRYYVFRTARLFVCTPFDLKQGTALLFGYLRPFWQATITLDPCLGTCCWTWLRNWGLGFMCPPPSHQPPIPRAVACLTSAPKLKSSSSTYTGTLTLPSTDACAHMTIPQYNHVSGGWNRHEDKQHAVVNDACAIASGATFLAAVHLHSFCQKANKAGWPPILFSEDKGLHGTVQQMPTCAWM